MTNNDAFSATGMDASTATSESNWHRSLASAIRDPKVLLDRLGLNDLDNDAVCRAAEAFPLLVPESFLARMTPGDPTDPLLRQVLPIGAELDEVPGFVTDAVQDVEFRKSPGLLQKYHGRALMIATGSCAVHCRYCFRRHYPYGDEPRRLDDWQPALDELAGDESVTEVLLSGGDPLMLTDQRLSQLLDGLAAISHLKRLRLHTRLPIVLPDRVTQTLLDMLSRLRAESNVTPIIVVHANHSAELVDDCATSLRKLIDAGLTVLNQAVLLRGVNDSVETQCELSEALINLGIIPYYLHQLDRVAGAAHFEVPVEHGRFIIREMRKKLPGYAVPRFVQEIPGEPHKTVLE